MPKTDKENSLQPAAPVKPQKNSVQRRSAGSGLPKPPSRSSSAALPGASWSQGDQRLVTAGEAAAYLRLSTSYVNKLRVEGGGPVFLKLSRAVRYRQADLEAWISSRQHSSTSAAQLALEAEAREGRD
jgi:hypothetical protein